eukprot:TRINITY_DN17606_c0_g1_i1.p1 TRINITY_DN17606_c0_g1~~TRINITY_DN17606_c0_g1_i1.p1  ORF type:complete len:139 (-),score=43.28 TRINITY_DN17606_c0_g1_i1:173-589(-)
MREVNQTTLKEEKNEKRKTDKEERPRNKRKKDRKSPDLRKKSKRLKNLKRKEIKLKIKHISEVSGTGKEKFKEADLEEDFDPEEHEKRMAEIFNDDYYGKDELEKPAMWDSDEEDKRVDTLDNEENSSREICTTREET